MKGHVTKMFIWWLLFSAFFQVPLMPSLIRMYRLAHQGVMTTGSIQGSTHHKELIYEFFVAGSSYSGVARTGVGGVPVSLIEGDRIAIYYLPSNPTVNAGGDVQALLDDEYEFRGLICLLALFGVCVLFLRVKLFPQTKILGMPAEKLKPWFF